MTVPIQSGDIKLFASQVMDDVPEGGGGPTSIVIRDGVSNDVFQDLSEVGPHGRPHLHAQAVSRCGHRQH